MPNANADGKFTPKHSKTRFMQEFNAMETL